MRTGAVIVACLLYSLPAAAQRGGAATASTTAVQVPVPNVIGLSLRMAQQNLANARLRSTATNIDGGAASPDDSVVRQSPPNPQPTAIGSIVALYVKKRAIVGTPNVIGRSYEDAIRIISRAELKPKGVTTAPSTDTALGSVLSQDPPPGAPIRSDHTIDLTIAGVPQVVGLPLRDAIVALERAHLQVGTTATKETPGIKDTTVLEQLPRAGQPARPQTAVSIVAAVPHLIVVPDFKGTRIDRISSLSDADSLKITAHYNPPALNADDSIVVAQSLEPNTRVPIGSPIELTVSQREAFRLAQLTIAPDSISLVAGDTARLSVEGVMSDGSRVPVAAGWKASAGRITSDGRYVAGKALGRVIVTASFGQLSATAVIRVAARRAQSPIPRPVSTEWWWIVAAVVGLAAVGWGVWRLWHPVPPPPPPPPPPTPTVPPLVFTYAYKAPKIETKLDATHGHGAQLSLVSYAGEIVHRIDPPGVKLFDEEEHHG